MDPVWSRWPGFGRVDPAGYRRRGGGNARPLRQVQLAALDGTHESANRFPHYAAQPVDDLGVPGHEHDPQYAAVLPSRRR